MFSQKRPSTRSLPVDLDYPAVLEDIKVAYSILGSMERATSAVAGVFAQLDFSSAAQIDNRRRRRKPKIETDGRLSYRPLTGRPELRRFLLLAELDEYEREEEVAGRLNTEAQQLRCFTKQIVKTVLNHNSFYAAVGTTLILCDYPAQVTLDMYTAVSYSRADGKTLTACSRAKQVFVKFIQQRFGDRIKQRKAGTAYRLAERRPDSDEIKLVRSSLLSFLPPLPALPTKMNVADHIRAMFTESGSELKRIHQFLDIQKFDKLAPLSVPAGPFDSHLWVPLIDRHCPRDSDSDGDDTMPDFNFDYFTKTVAKERNRRRRMAPGSLYIHVDGFNKGLLCAASPSCNVIFEEGASVVKLVAKDDDGETATFATYILTYDSPKSERWEVELGELGMLTVIFDYDDDETVTAGFCIQPINGPLSEGRNSLVEKFSEVQEGELHCLPAMRHRQRTCDCPSTELYPQYARTGWPDNLLAHASCCLYCQENVAAAWASECPGWGVLKKASTSDTTNCDQIAVEMHVDHCLPCEAILRIIESPKVWRANVGGWATIRWETANPHLAAAAHKLREPVRIVEPLDDPPLTIKIKEVAGHLEINVSSENASLSGRKLDLRLTGERFLNNVVLLLGEEENSRCSIAINLSPERLEDLAGPVFISMRVLGGAAPDADDLRVNALEGGTVVNSVSK